MQSSSSVRKDAGTLAVTPVAGELVSVPQRPDWHGKSSRRCAANHEAEIATRVGIAGHTSYDRAGSLLAK